MDPLIDTDSGPLTVTVCVVEAVHPLEETSVSFSEAEEVLLQIIVTVFPV